MQFIYPKIAVKEAFPQKVVIGPFESNNRAVTLHPVYRDETGLHNKRETLSRIGESSSSVLIDLIDRDQDKYINFIIEVNSNVSFQGACNSGNNQVESALPKLFRGTRCVATLFKNDYKLLPKWVAWYSRLGFDGFMLYYNGKISDIANFIDSNKNKFPANTLFIQWDVDYWSKYRDGHAGSLLPVHLKHHAQPLMLNHALYSLKGRFTEAAFFDLDEYLLITDKNKSLDHIMADNCAKIFLSKWAEIRATNPCVSSSLHPLEFLFERCEVYVSEECVPFPSRTKYICQVEGTALAGIHRPEAIYKSNVESIPTIHISNEAVVVHFHNFTGQIRDFGSNPPSKFLRIQNG